MTTRIRCIAANACHTCTGLLVISWLQHEEIRGTRATSRDREGYASHSAPGAFHLCVRSNTYCIVAKAPSTNVQKHEPLSLASSAQEKPYRACVFNMPWGNSATDISLFEVAASAHAVLGMIASSHPSPIETILHRQVAEKKKTQYG